MYMGRTRDDAGNRVKNMRLYDLALANNTDNSKCIQLKHYKFDHFSYTVDSLPPPPLTN